MTRADWRLTEAQEQVFRDNLPLVHYIVIKSFRLNQYSQDYDDYVQSGCIGLINAVKRMNQNKNRHELSAYLANSIRHSIYLEHKRPYQTQNAYLRTGSAVLTCVSADKTATMRQNLLS